ncbi:hypothetical protein, partial [Roseibium sp. RKSG952]|uniref:hypothetical protein n=1 Tax=Roseibium sp. RKSG952 TaxID=2529384 RepID=UPI0018AD21AE
GVDARSQLERHLKDTKTIIARGNKARAISEVLSKLPEQVPEIIDNNDKITVGRAVRSAKTRLATMTKAQEILKRLPVEPPTVIDHQESETAGRNIVEAKKRLQIAETAVKKTDEELETVRSQMKTLVAEMDNSCPVCGHHISDANELLYHQAHEGDRGHA